MTQATKVADSADLARASAWARQVYGALKDWEIARRGQWSTWDNGAILLTLDRTPDGKACETITIGAANDAIAFHTRDWETDVPQPGQSFAEAIASLKELTRGWFAGEVALAAFYMGDVWQGALAIDPARLEEEVQRGLQWIGMQTGVDRVEIQTARAENDKLFGLAINGQPFGPVAMN